MEKGAGVMASRWMTAGMCVAISVVLHVVVAILICLRFLMVTTDVVEIKKEVVVKNEVVIAIQLDERKPVRRVPLTNPDVIVPPTNAPLTPQELKALTLNTPPAVPPELTAKPEVKSRFKLKDVPKYARTADDQLAGKVPETNLEGEHDTIEASNADTVAGAPDRASVKGVKPKDGLEETVDTTFQDGILEHMNRGGERSKPESKPPTEEIVDPEKVAKIDQEEMKSSVESTKELGDAPEKGKLASTNKEEKEFLETQKKMEMNEDLPTSKNTAATEKRGLEDQKKTIANNQPDPDAMKQKVQEKKQKKVQTQPKTAENKRASDNTKKGFRSEARATVMEGTISRRSKIASKNVKSTPVGKYMAQISKLVEKEWQRRCMMHADLIQPGTLRISFMVDESGKVKNIDIISKTSGSESQESLTFQALTSVKIPSMPKKVKVSQGGDPLEFRYYFRFQ